MNNIIEAVNEMDIPAEGKVFPDATPVLATPGAFLGGVAVSSAVIGAFELGRGGGSAPATQL
ncbi:hypothetical protein ACIOGX_12560 [Streptomyces sp. NPDC088147]|uniref:Uncharacterized protein n=2 Tax=Streptomyces scopuliridis TaxID=452529 RepID=A0A2T7SPE2_9ACTN|nr:MULTISPECIES: hypothetical protein [Streptomyces]MCL7381355.1 hypothetical protein [Streptomyces sp. 35G-GA-8]PVE04738.1 hypothetical protein Y717_09680 [Streptomyces scopuliridis RB72]RYJ25126.1 hypothetical protein CU044_4298 [Streptomyces sp. L-9-10]WSB34610.1 hypothetical protein OG949_18210 [Streptomyces scopuliridis]WSB98861.1 hypothetical protein OG835_18795 [Streptomyces scopuliridis]